MSKRIALTVENLRRFIGGQMFINRLGSQELVGGIKEITCPERGVIKVVFNWVGRLKNYSDVWDEEGIPKGGHLEVVWVLAFDEAPSFRLSPELWRQVDTLGPGPGYFSGLSNIRITFCMPDSGLCVKTLAV